jgi:hypothetical protein
MSYNNIAGEKIRKCMSRFYSKLMYQKQKIVVFSKKKSNQNFSYEMFGEKISQQDYYNYLGLLFNYILPLIHNLNSNL